MLCVRWHSIAWSTLYVAVATIVVTRIGKRKKVGERVRVRIRVCVCTCVSVSMLLLLLMLLMLSAASGPWSTHSSALRIASARSLFTFTVV